MKTFSKIFALSALWWAIATPVLMPVLEGPHHGNPEMLHIFAHDLRSALPKEPANDAAVVSLPAQRASNMANALDFIADDVKKLPNGVIVYTMFQSAIVITLCVCIFCICKKDAKAA